MALGIGQAAARKRRASKPALFLCLALVVAGAVWIAVDHYRPAAPGPKDLEGNSVDIAQSDLPTGEQVDQMDVTDDTGVRFTVASVGLDVPLGELSEVDGEITPPGFTSAYVVRNRSVDISQPETGPIYLAVHAIADGVAPGNYLADVGGSIQLAPGADIEVGNATYAVTGSEKIEKSQLPTRADVWGHGPGSLVVITCIQNEDGSSTDNLIITASLA